MRELKKRLERLESAVTPAEPLRIVRQIIGVKDGRPVAWNPARAYIHRRRGDELEDVVVRDPGEPVEAFEARCAGHFEGRDYLIG